jgi:hypothetical protein
VRYTLSGVWLGTERNGWVVRFTCIAILILFASLRSKSLHVLS